MIHLRTSMFALLIAIAIPVVAVAESPYSLEDIFHSPWPFGVSARSISISDDGAFVACGWDAGGEGHRDLYIYNANSEAWCKQTDLWADKEARERREFSRELDTKRHDWEEEHAEDEDAEGEGEDGDGVTDGDATDSEDAEVAEEETFDEQELIDEFEEDLQKQREKFRGIGQTMFCRDSHELLYFYSGALYSLDLSTPGAVPTERLRHEAGFSSMRLAGDTSDVLLVSGSDLVLWSPDNGRLRQLTTGGSGEKANTSGYSLTPDVEWLAYSSRDYRGKRKTKMAEFLTDDPYMTDHNYIRPGDQTERVNMTILDLSVEPAWKIDVELPEEPYYQVNTLEWSPIPGDLRLLAGIISGDTETFSAYIITPPTDDFDEPSIELVYQEEDEAWINWSRTSMGWGSDGQLLLHSEHSGIASLYMLHEIDAPDESEADDEAEDTEENEELVATHEPGDALNVDGEVGWFQPLRESATTLYATDFGDPAARGVVRHDLNTGESTTLVGADGWVSDSFVVNESENLAVFGQSTSREPAQLSISNLVDPAEVILDRVPADWREWSETWNVEFITVPTIDTAEFEHLEARESDSEPQDIHCRLYLPPNHDPCESYPLLIWLHGAGYSQVVKYDAGFYTLFHPYAAEELGWIVAEIDYRGSEGYGRDWRVDVADRLGHPETADLVAVKRHLIANYGADPERTAMWGWSYGGFLTLMAHGLVPGEIPVGCAVAPVNRWENYYYWYSTCRLGHPDENEDAYDRSAAETYLENVSDDLLILHGLRDSNTLFQSIAQYLEEGHELGINVELKLFPSDSHGMGNDFHYLRLFEAIVDYCEENWEGD